MAATCREVLTTGSSAASFLIPVPLLIVAGFSFTLLLEGSRKQDPAKSPPKEKNASRYAADSQPVPVKKVPTDRFACYGGRQISLHAYGFRFDRKWG